MANDSAAGAPQKPGSGSGTIFGIPYLYVGAAGVGVVLLWFYLRNRGSAAGGTSSGGAVSADSAPGLLGGTSFSTDPNTGAPIDPTTGLPFLTSQGGAGTGTIDAWVKSVEGALTGLGYAPALISQALYDYTNGNPLSDQEAGVINAGLGKVGYPPNLLPFFGNVPNLPPVMTGGPITGSVPPGTTPKTPAQLKNIAAHVASPLSVIQNELNHLAPSRIGVNGVSRSPSFAQAIVSGTQKVPKGIAAPAGYKIGPNGYLSKVA